MSPTRGGSHEETAADKAFRALAEPRRRAILSLVSHHEMAAGEIASTFEVTRPAISQHLTVLKDAGLLSERREGTRRFYRSRIEGLDELRHFLDDTWAQSLDLARRLVEEERNIHESDRSREAK